MTSAKRLAEAQVLLRDANERIREREPDARGRARLVFLCECTDLRCNSLLKLSLREYEEVRRVPSRFLTAVGHDTPEFEVVVTENKRFAVVEKVGPAKEVSEANDSRSRGRSARAEMPRVQPRAPA